MKLDLLWLESTLPGTAAGSHLRGTIERLTRLGTRPNAVIHSEKGETGGVGARLWRILPLLLRASLRARPNRVLLVRAHRLAFPAILSQRLVGGKVIALVQGNSADAHAAYGWLRYFGWTDRLVKWNLRLAHVHVAPDDGILEWIRNDVGIEGVPSFVVPNGFDGAAVEQAVEGRSVFPPASAPDCAYAVFVGKFAPWQGVEEIIAAVAMPEWPKGLPMVFVGDGALRDVVERASAATSLIRYVGRVNSDEALAWTAGAMVALAPRRSGPASDRGVSPYKVLEASAVGTPIVASRVRGQARLIDELGSGLLISPDAPREIAQAVRRLYEDADLRMRLSTSGRMKSKRYSWAAGATGLGAALERAGYRRGE